MSTEIKYGDSFEKEFVLALEQKRQPVCVSCKEPLDTITQMQYEGITWTWNKEKMQFEKEKTPYGEDSDKPKCSKCGYGEWEMLDQESGLTMGVSY